MPQEKRISLGEFELIRWIQDQADRSAALVMGIGDDCAIQTQQAGQDLLTSTDLLIEGVHFRRDWTGMFALGRKSAAVNISDIAAMGGIPQSLFLGIGRPREVEDSEIQELISGFLSETRAHGAALAGGDLCRSPGPLMISVTVQGTIAAGEAVCRKGASYGDAIYVSGWLGDSALALEVLQNGKQPGEYLASRLHTPSPRVELGKKLAGRQQATAMLDISDGLLGDLGHILRASGVGAEIELDSLPLSPAFQQAMKQDASLIELALAGGEDYELVFTSPLKDLSDQADLNPPVTRIGAICQQPGIRIRRADGELYYCRRGGFDHFA